MSIACFGSTGISPRISGNSRSLNIGEIEAHGSRAENFGLGHPGIVGSMIGPAVVAQQLPREHHVVGGHRRAVGKMRRRIEREGDVASGLVGLHRPRQQSVKRERLVVAARQQALDDVAANGLQGETLDDKGIEAVEGAKHALDQSAALRRVGIDVGQRGEAGRQRRYAVHCDGGFGDDVGRNALRRLGNSRQRKAGQHAGQQLGAAKCGPHSKSVGFQRFLGETALSAIQAFKRDSLGEQRM